MLTIAPFVARRLILLDDVDYVHWLVVDNIARCLSLVGVLIGLRCGELARAAPRACWRTSYWVFLLLFAAENAEQVFVDPLLQQHLRIFQLSPWPRALDPALRAFDLSAGLLLVAISEEFVFRRLLFAAIERCGLRNAAVVPLGAIVFALVHFTSGVVDTMANAFVHGVPLGTAFWLTRRLSICIASHYLIDLYVGVSW